MWVSPMVKEAPRIGTRLFDIFDREGRYLGRVDLPFVLYGTPRPIVRNGMLYGVTRDELGVSFLVTAQVVRSGSDT